MHEVFIAHRDSQMVEHPDLHALVDMESPTIQYSNSVIPYL